MSHKHGNTRVSNASEIHHVSLPPPSVIVQVPVASFRLHRYRKAPWWQRSSWIERERRGCRRWTGRSRLEDWRSRVEGPTGPIVGPPQRRACQCRYCQGNVRSHPKRGDRSIGSPATERDFFCNTEDVIAAGGGRVARNMYECGGLGPPTAAVASMTTFRKISYRKHRISYVHSVGKPLPTRCKKADNFQKRSSHIQLTYRNITPLKNSTGRLRDYQKRHQEM